MDGKRRDLMHNVMAGDPRVLPYLYHFDQFRRCDQMLRWLYSHRYVGSTFIEWARGTEGNSMLEISRFILKQLDRDRGEMPILLGKDYLA